jgi:hypothetical protein
VCCRKREKFQELDRKKVQNVIVVPKMLALLTRASQQYGHHNLPLSFSCGHFRSRARIKSSWVRQASDEISTTTEQHSSETSKVKDLNAERKTKDVVTTTPKETIVTSELKCKD